MDMDEGDARQRAVMGEELLAGYPRIKVGTEGTKGWYVCEGWDGEGLLVASL